MSSTSLAGAPPAADAPLGPMRGRPSVAAAEAKHIAILDAAADAFLAHGFGAAGMDDIARRAGVSKATIYSHFRDKERLFGAIVELRCRGAAQESELGEAFDAPIEAVLTAVGRRFLDLVFRPQSLPLYRVVVAESGRFPELGRIFFSTGPERIVQSLARYLSELCTRGALDLADPDVAAEQFFGGVLGYADLRLLVGIDSTPPDEATRDRVVAAQVRTFLRGNRGSANGASSCA